LFKNKIKKRASKEKEEISFITIFFIVLIHYEFEFEDYLFLNSKNEN